jgi:hypothetical protein
MEYGGVVVDLSVGVISCGTDHGFEIFELNSPFCSRQNLDDFPTALEVVRILGGLLTRTSTCCVCAIEIMRAGLSSLWGFSQGSQHKTNKG